MDKSVITGSTMRYMDIIRYAGVMAATMLAGGCAQLLGIEDLPRLLMDASPELAPDASPQAAVDAGPDAYAVRGIAAGLLGPVALELRFGNAVELLAVTGDGAFTFETRLEHGTSYTVVFVDAETPCILRNQTGVIMGSDTAIELACTGASLASVVVSGVAPEVALVPGTTEYVADLPFSQPSVTMTATVATAGDTLTIAGTSVASGAPSAPISMNLGDNPIDIVVDNSLGWQRTYRMLLRRAGELAQYAYGKASNTDANDLFGHSVALSGDTLVVGAPLEASTTTGVGGSQTDDSAPNSGAVYVFRRSGTTWQQEAFIKASNTDANDYFGISVAVSDDTLAVGAYQEDSGATSVNGNQADDSASNSGAVYVFRRSGTTWQQEAYIKASNTGANDQFGWSVGLSGDTLAVGARLEDSGATSVGGSQGDNSSLDSGAVYVFHRSGTTWQQETYIKASNTGAGDAFGISVAISDDTLAIGAYQEDSAATGVGGSQADNSASNSGAVYVFRRSGTTWQQEAYLKASNTGAGDQFGTNLTISADSLAVGAYQEDSASTGVDGSQADNSASNSGAVYVFRRSGTTWQQEAYLKASNTGSGDSFGASLAFSGDTLAVGAYQEDSATTGVGGNQADNSAVDSGAVYVFVRSDTNWQQQAYLKASNTDPNDAFGVSLAVSADTFAVGADGEDSATTGVNGSQTDNAAAVSGAIYIFH